MAQKGELNPPVETVQQSFRRAMKAYGNADCQIAIFMIGGKISSTSETSAEYKRRVDLFESSLIGVYDIATDARQILDDIEAYYSGFPFLPPVFRSSGRRIKQ